MPVFRFEPAREIENISKKMKNFFEELPDNFSFEMGAYSPRLDLAEDDSKIYVNVEIPGVSKESIKLSIQNNILTIKGDKKRNMEDEKINFFRNERLFGSFSRSIELPLDVDVNDITAKLDNGVLSITLIKVQKKASERTIEIN